MQKQLPFRCLVYVCVCLALLFRLPYKQFIHCKRVTVFVQVKNNKQIAEKKNMKQILNSRSEKATEVKEINYIYELYSVHLLLHSKHFRLFVLLVSVRTAWRALSSLPIHCYTLYSPMIFQFICTGKILFQLNDFISYVCFKCNIRKQKIYKTQNVSVKVCSYLFLMDCFLMHFVFLFFDEAIHLALTSRQRGK